MNNKEQRVCTKTSPYTKERERIEGKYWKHTNTEIIGECLQGCCDKVKCLNCGLTWTQEIPD